MRGAARALPAASLLFASRPSLAQGSPRDLPVLIQVDARELTSFDLHDASHMRVGSLEFRGGLVLTSPFKDFGGLSGLRVDAKGEQFLSFSDNGVWFTGRLLYKNDRLSGLGDVMAAPMLGDDGKRLAAKGWFDTESIARDGSKVYIGIERVNQIVVFDFAKGGLRARGQPILLPPGVDKLPFNKGLEALVFVPKGKPLAGTLIAMSERGLDEAGNLISFLIGGPTPGLFTVKRKNNYDISDATLMPNGDVLILERKFSWLEGVHIRIRRVPLANFAPGAVVDGAVIFEVDLGYEIDNMEGIDVHLSPSGETIITMVSDDNFSVIQRTLLLQFALVDV